MKKTLFMSLLAAALMGGQGFAGTVVSGTLHKTDHTIGFLTNVSTDDGSYATGGVVTVSEIEGQGEDGISTPVTGGVTFKGGNAEGNTAIITGGKNGRPRLNFQAPIRDKRVGVFMFTAAVPPPRG